VVEAMMEERVTRVKKYIGFPHEALDYVKKKYNLDPKCIYVDGLESGVHIINTKEEVIGYRSRLSERKWFNKALIERFHLGGAVYGIKNLLAEVSFFLKGHKGTARKFLEKEFPQAIITNVPHHLSHAWAPILFIKDHSKKRLILTLDGEGDALCGSINIYNEGDIKVLHEFSNVNSLGLLYASVVDLMGMTRNEHEFKVMVLAPYAKPSSGEKVYAELKKIIWFDDLKMNLESKIDMRRATQYLIANEFFKYRFDSLAYGIQKLTEEIIKDIARASIKKYGCSDLVVAGGVFMNVKANQYLRELPEVSSLFVAPSGGDESIALGNAVYGYAKINNHDLSKLTTVTNLYLGSDYSDEKIKKDIDNFDFGLPVNITYFDPKGIKTIEQKVAEILSKDSVVGRFKGRAEWGARALGNRSILANPTSRDNVKLINEMIKGRDFWMPFATSMLYERRNDYLVDAENYLAPYMSITFNTKPIAHTEIIAALHPCDLTSRFRLLQFNISLRKNDRYWWYFKY
jgi:carbamoyltransferase